MHKTLTGFSTLLGLGKRKQSEILIFEGLLRVNALSMTLLMVLR